MAIIPGAIMLTKRDTSTSSPHRLVTPGTILRWMRPLRVVVRGILGKHLAEMSLPEDQHPVGDFGSDGQHEARHVRSRSFPSPSTRSSGVDRSSVG